MVDENYVVEMVLEDDKEEDNVEFVDEEIVAGKEINDNMDYDDIMKFVDDEFHSDKVLNQLEEMNAKGINFLIWKR